MALTLLMWDNVNNRVKRTDTPATGGGTLSDFRSGSQTISVSATSTTITFPTALINTDYSLMCSWMNVVDTNPQFQPINITALSTTQFTAKWNAPVDTSNYLLNWQAIANGARAGTNTVSASATSLTVTFSTALPSMNFSIICSWANLTDSNPQLQPLVVTALSTTQFTVKWNAPVDTANYVINWQAIGTG